MAMRNQLIKSSTLWLLTLATVLLVVGFQAWSPLAGGVLLDTLWTLEGSRDLLAALTPTEKQIHIWITLLLDVPFPLVYGGLLAGLALRFGGTYGAYLALPALLAIPVDLMENAIQVLALAGYEGGLHLKALLTPLKFLLVYGAILIAIGSSIISVGIKRLRR